MEPLFERRPYLICSRFLNILQPGPLSSAPSHWQRTAVTPTSMVSLLLAHAAAGINTGEDTVQILTQSESVGCARRQRPCAHHDRLQRRGISATLLPSCAMQEPERLQSETCRACHHR
ncbi:hypothetical protein CC86DRAFT_2956 [Ophiobolus disseminans]|uniref:Uncharacterized protein n=1 Tax=Ophiobolus disseminans TaxID=1469910 RepID=A0A6A7AI40_9PLEO|nr:hypothetical protein CC86DRAFT_2956 [Ophiobolus disseminans]